MAVRIIRDVIKGNEADVADIDFQVEGNASDSFLCFSLFTDFQELFISLQPDIW